jgi:hypothetical protein
MSLSADLATTEPKPLPFDSSQTSSPKTHSKRIRFSKVTRKVPILERHVRRAEISVRQCRARSSRKTLPSNKRLLPAARARETKSAQAKGKRQPTASHSLSSPLLAEGQNSLMINRPSTEIPHQQPAAPPIQIRRCRRIIIAMRRSRSPNDCRCGALT